ncbi:MAG: phytoene/squalene synthase family protein [Tannerellaceae bacterium]|nr:phytoene/squalene synthase family protein [Tannerellaceae bacterium]
MDKLFYDVSFETSRVVTRTYSTSFTIGVKCLAPDIQDAIYSIYGFVRFADEIVDTFHQYDKAFLLDDFEQEYNKAFRLGISLNPVLNSFQHTVKKYRIPDELIRSFLESMRADLVKKQFTAAELNRYIYGSAEAVGLMCLQVFVKGDEEKYQQLAPYAKRLGAAFQKINFLRDLRHDTASLHRVYFPVLQEQSLNEENKKMILDEIQEDYRFALEGIRQLPDCARLGVYTAYLYYETLTQDIRNTRADRLMQYRVRISNLRKLYLFCKAYRKVKWAPSNLHKGEE